jgi:hypothetical protein
MIRRTGLAGLILIAAFALTALVSAAKSDVRSFADVKARADPAFVADIEKLGIVPDLLPGAELQKVIGASMVMASQTQEQARKFYEHLFKAH